MSAAKTKTMAPGAGRRGALIGLYLVALIAGYSLGERGQFPFRPIPQAQSSPLARLGAALSNEPLTLSPRGFAALRADIEAVRASLGSQQRTVLDLVVAARGLATSGVPAWDQAEKHCNALRWRRCDRAALQAVARQSYP